MGKNLDEGLRPISHREDPDTSKQMELKLRESGRLGQQLADVYRLVEIYPGKTASELALRGAVTPSLSADPTDRKYQVRRRLSDLRARELVERERIPGTRESIWFKR